MIEEAFKGNGAAGVLPGGTIRVVAATGNTVSLVETFPRPLVIGYVGFDMAIGPGGVLGAPTATHAILSNRVESPTLERSQTLVSVAGLREAYQRLFQAKNAGDSQAATLVTQLDRLSTLVPAQSPCNVYGFNADNRLVKIETRDHDLSSRIPKVGLPKVVVYWGELTSSIRHLKKRAT